MRFTAQEYWERGWSIIPLEPRGKRPLVSWRDYQIRRPSPDELDEWFAEDGPNLGIVTGEISGLAVLDIDSTDALKFAMSYREGRGLGEQTTPMATTGKGYHVYYTYPKGLRNLQADPNWPGIDLRAEGGYVVAPPSLHASGRQYQWELDWRQPLAPMPQWMIRPGAPQQHHTRGLPVGEGKRNMTLASFAGACFAVNLDFATTWALCRTWNQQNPRPLPEDEVLITVQSIQRTHQRNHPQFEGVEL
jgi:hypothetical protein